MASTKEEEGGKGLACPRSRFFDLSVMTGWLSSRAQSIILFFFFFGKSRQGRFVRHSTYFLGRRVSTLRNQACFFIQIVPPQPNRLAVPHPQRDAEHRVP